MEKIATTSICPVCLKTIPAYKYEKGTEVFMVKTCSEHGTFTNKIAKDANRFFDKTYSVKGKEFTPLCEFHKACGNDCGWCDKHEQHICTGLIEITDACNMSCPICYFGPKGKFFISKEDFSNRLNNLITVEKGSLDVLQISGGECLIHPEFIELLDIAIKNKGIGRILINTNGLGLLENDIIFKKIRANRDKVEIYLQFDGFDDAVYETLRGRKLLDKKLEIIDLLDKNDIKICLAATIYERNLKEIKNILDLSVKVKNISGITFQRLTKVGSALSSKIPSVFQEDILLAIHNSKYMDYKGIIPLPCSHENCTSLGFLFCDKDKVTSLSDYIDFTKCKDTISNRIAFDASVLKYFEKNLCSCFVSKFFTKSPIMEKLETFAKGMASTNKDMKIIRIIVKNFMDSSNFDFERARKCCTAVATSDNKIIPFCLYNNLKGKSPWTK